MATWRGFVSRYGIASEMILPTLEFETTQRYPGQCDPRNS
jgi:hypothetical protein